MINKTYFPKSKDTNGTWHFVDAQGKVLGRLATEISKLLIGKDEPTYTPGVPSGNKVVVTNAGKIAVTGNKKEGKVYFRHTRYPSGIREVKLGEMMEKFPTRPLEKAVKGMLPKNKLQKKYMANLYIYEGEEHPHTAQEKAKK